MDVILHSLCKSYGNHPVLKNFSATFLEGSITCITGPSGCGKTTLLRLLLGLEHADSGEIKGTDVPKAAVFQENRLFEHVSPVANIAAVLPGKANRDWIFAKLATLGLGSHLTVPTHTLSGGMKRRVALARAMLTPASLVVLDEPFTGLDEENKKKAMSFVREHAASKTLLLVTHDASDSTFFPASTLVLSPVTP